MNGAELLDEIERFRERIGISETAIGLGALNDGKFVSELKAGRRCWPETVEKVLAFLRSAEQQGRAA